MKASLPLRHLTILPKFRNRRTFTSTFFLATFLGAVVTVGLSETILPCPAKTRNSQFRRETVAAFNDKDEDGKGLGQGERVKLTRKGGWIEIEGH